MAKRGVKKNCTFWLAPKLISAYLHMVGWTGKTLWLGRESVEQLKAEQQACVFALWHCNATQAAWALGHRGLAVLISSSDDGELAARTVALLGNSPIRGSSSQGGAKALLEMIRWLKKGHDGAITPDGPRGPAYKVQKGTITLASKSGVPLVPFHMESVNQRTALKSWDNHRFPRLFSTKVIRTGEPIYVPPKLSSSETESWRQTLEQAMLDNQNRVLVELVNQHGERPALPRNTRTTMKYDVYGLGNPLVDVIVNIDDQMLKELDLTKGTMNLVDQPRQAEILEKTKEQTPLVALGGSCANSMVMIAQLGGRSAFCGNLGKDDFAREYEAQLRVAGVESYTKQSDGMTGSTVILVSPDAERTMNTHLGQCQELTKEAVDLEAIGVSKYLYVEGYLWDTPQQQEAVLHALAHAKKQGIQIALSLSDAFVVDRHKEAFTSLLKDYVDLVFCNELEAETMTGEKDPELMIKKLHQSVGHVALTLGKKGSILSYDGAQYQVDAVAVDAIDTTGAGDSFAAGYLFGLTQGYEIPLAGRLASQAASVVVSQIGPRYQGNLKEKLQEFLK